MLEYDFELAVLILQKEFAQRLVAEPGEKDYSRISVSLFYKAYCEILEIVPKGYFKPTPKVDSAMIKILPRKYKPFELDDEEFFSNLVKNLFNHRRKKIKTILKNKYRVESKELPFLEYRVEKLDPKKIGVLSNHLKKILEK